MDSAEFSLKPPPLCSRNYGKALLIIFQLKILGTPPFLYILPDSKAYFA